MDHNVKISICIPSRNALNYVRYAIESVLNQEYEDYELLVSDNHSNDGTWDYLKTLSHPKLRIMQPPKMCSMSGHYEWLLTQTKGDWVTIIGADDGMQPYFFTLADYLIDLAHKHNVYIINGERAYYFWEGCENLYGDMQTNFMSIEKFSIKNAKKEFFPQLLRGGGYFGMPQMYAGSLVHKDVINKIKNKQNGRFYFDINPDAYGACAFASINELYIHSMIPLIWVGTSPKSTGIDNSQNNKEHYIQAKEEEIICAPLIKSYEYAKISITTWMWEAMLQAHNLQDEKTKAFYRSKKAKYLIIATAIRTAKSDEEFTKLYELADFNALNHTLLSILSKILWLYDKRTIFARALRKALRMCGITKYIKIMTFYHSQTQVKDMLEASQLVLEKINKQNQKWYNPHLHK